MPYNSVSSVTVAPQYPTWYTSVSSVTDQVPHRDYPERSVYNTLHFCEFCDCCTTIPYTSVSSVTHPVPYRDYPPVLEQIQYPTEITRTLQNLSVTFHENGVEGLHGVVMVQGLPIMCHSHQLQLRLYTKKKTKQTENSARMHSIEGNNN